MNRPIDYLLFRLMYVVRISGNLIKHLLDPEREFVESVLFFNPIGFTPDRKGNMIFWPRNISVI